MKRKGPRLTAVENVQRSPRRQGSMMSNFLIADP
jgi:hypothetical protein